jgi:hypothetical protein
MISFFKQGRIEFSWRQFMALSATLLNYIMGDQASVPRVLSSAKDEDLQGAAVELLVNILYHINALPAEKGSFFEITKKAALSLRADEERRRRKRDKIMPSEFAALIALNAGSVERRLRPMRDSGKPDNTPGEMGRDDFEVEIGRLVPMAARAILVIYDPSLVINSPGADLGSLETVHGVAKSVSDKRANRAWSELDPETFTFWRMGTTSLIIKCSKSEVEAAAYRETLILKCVSFPWNLIPAIAESTASYADRYKDLDSVAVRAEASSNRWVLMPYQDGPTLAEYFKAQDFHDQTSFEQIAFARKIALGLAVALDGLSGEIEVDKVKPEHQHLDLSPSNIIMAPGVTSETGREIRFIDLGQNFLYTRQIGMADHDDAVYIAPEVKNRGSSPTADLYSLAIITIELLSGVRSRDGRVPDAIYEISPTLGRLLDDMLDDDASKRLLLVPHVGSMKLRDVSHHLQETFDLVKHEPVASGSALKRRWAQWAPASHEVSSLVSTLWELRKEEGRTQLRSQIGYLTFMSLIASAAWWFIFTRTALFHIDDLIFGHWDSLPHGQLLDASVIGFSQGMVASKFYQTILARLTLRGIGSKMATLTEIVMRGMTIVAVPTTAIAVMWRPELWAWSCAAGAALVAIANLLTLRVAARFTRLGKERFTTVPLIRRQVPGGYEQWWWTMLMYAFVIAIIATGLQTGWMRDAQAYVIGLLVINFAIHYASKCVVAGASVRGGLARAFATGERLSALDHRTTGGKSPSSPQLPSS